MAIIFQKNQATIFTSVTFLTILLFVLLPLETYALTGTTQKPPNNLGLKGYWAFDEGNGTKTTDASGSANTGTMTNMEAADWVSGRKSKALDFDGSNEFIDLTSAVSGISGDTAFTMCAWIKTDSASVAQAIVATGNAAVALNAAALFINANSNGSFSLEFAGGNTASTATGVIAAGEWYHLCGTKTAGAINTTTALYLNGQSVAIDSASSNTPSISATDASIGRFISADYYFDGKIDDVRVYGRALSASDIRLLYGAKVGQLATSRNSYLTSGLVGLWSFDGVDMNSETIYDRSGSGYNGTFVNFSTTTNVVSGKIGQALYFNGVDNQIDIPNLDAYSVYSVSMWLKRDQTASGWFEGLIGCSGSNGGGGWSTGIDGFTVNGRIFTSKIGVTGNYSDGVIEDLEWHHIAITRDGSFARFYFDGVLDSTIADTDSSFNCSGEPYAIGNSNVSTPLKGTLDDVRLYNRNLSASEVKRLYNLGKSTTIR